MVCALRSTCPVVRMIVVSVLQLELSLTQFETINFPLIDFIVARIHSFGPNRSVCISVAALAFGQAKH